MGRGRPDRSKVSDSQANPAQASAVPAPEPQVQVRPGWRDVWQIPALVLAGGLIVAGAYHAWTSTPAPDFKGYLHTAEELIASDETERAIERLNADVFPYVGTDKLSIESRAEFHRLMGRALFKGQRQLGIDREDNNKNIIASYLESEALHAKLTPADIGALCETFIAMGELDRARARADSLSAEERPRRVELYRRLVDRAMTPAVKRDELALDLVSALLTDPQLEQSDRAWALARQAELQVDKGFAEDAIGRLLRELPRLDSVTPGERGTLHLLLARAYVDVGSIKAAAQQLDYASELISETDERLPQLHVLQGQIASLRGDHAEAREKFESVASGHAPPRWMLSAQFGLAQSAAAQGDDEESLLAFGNLADALKAGERSREITPERICQSLTDRADDRFDRGLTEVALRFATLAERVIGERNEPATTLFRLAACHRRIADETIEAIKKQGTSAMALAELDPATRTQARSHLMSAGSYYQRHSDKVVLTDVAAYSDSLWMAGDCYDRAGDQEAASRIFQLYVAERPGDPRQPEARFRLAQAYQSRGDLENASAIYRDLVHQRGEGDGAGPWADASEVPLAQTLLLDANADNDAEAEQILREVASGRAGGPETPAFRGAVFELANHYYRKGEYDLAIERFDEASKRYPKDPQVLAARFKLADSLRLSAADIEKALMQALPPAEKVRLDGVRQDRLTRAQGLFEQVRRAIDAKDERRRTATEEAFLRNSYYYLGECAFRLKDYEGAITHYNAAKDRFATDPASLVAMTQIVSCHLRQNDLKRARAANERAKRFYASLPATVWEDPTLPMTRGDWERWLESTAELWKDRDTQATAAAPEAEKAENP